MKATVETEERGRLYIDNGITLKGYSNNTFSEYYKHLLTVARYTSGLLLK